MGIDAEVGDADAVADADVVCTCTTATEPLFDGERLARGAHVNAVGAYRPETREVDTETVRRARVVVETRAAALEEAGDLLLPIGEGAIDGRPRDRGSAGGRAGQPRSVRAMTTSPCSNRSAWRSRTSRWRERSSLRRDGCRERGSNPHEPKLTGF